MTKPVLRLENEAWLESVRHTAGELARRAEPALAVAPSSAPCVFVAENALDLLAAACGLAATQREGMVVPRHRLTPAVRDLLEAKGLAIVDLPGARLERAGSSASHEGRVHLLTSGSTGEPKVLQHSWESLFTMSRVRHARPARWLLTYQAGTYAWYQLVTAWLFLPHQALILAGGTSPAELIMSAAAGGVTAISSTPTFWRIAILQADSEHLGRLARTVESLTLGGEPVDQAILDQLRALYPGARLVHIYASTEAGASLVVSDGLAGFPAEWLDDERRSPQVRVADGRLWLRSPHAAIGFRNWFDTGDIAEIRGGRVHLLGRAGRGLVNVGGAKAFAADIERVLLEHPDVLWCRVRGVRAPIVGQLVAAEVVWRGSAPPAPAEALTRYCTAHLPEHSVPRVWEWLGRIPASENWKTEV